MLAALMAAAAASSARAAGEVSIESLLAELEGYRYLDISNPAKDPRGQFLVYAKDAKFAQEVLDVAVKHRAAAQQFFGTSIIWKEPAILLVYPSRTAYYRAIGLYGTGGVQAHLRYKGFKFKLVATFEGENLLGHTLRHELTHLIVTDMSNRQYFDGHRRDPVETPVWIQEGLAEYLTADQERRECFERLTYYAVHEQKTIPLRTLLVQMDYDNRIVLHYAQSYSFVAFIAAAAAHGRDKLRTYLQYYNEPDLAKDPLKAFLLAFQVSDASVETIEKQWYDWIGTHYDGHFAPVVLRTHPADKAKAANRDGRVWVKFDKPMDPASFSAATMALRQSSTGKLGDDQANLLTKAAFTYDSAESVLLIEVPGGLATGAKYTLALSDHVTDAQRHGLVAEKFDEMKRDDWWKSTKIEPQPDDKRAEKPEDAAKLVASITFTTKTKD
jgi:hypothetical protein